MRWCRETVLIGGHVSNFLIAKILLSPYLLFVTGSNWSMAGAHFNEMVATLPSVDHQLQTSAMVKGCRTPAQSQGCAGCN
jgi:hypothetical protein